MKIIYPNKEEEQEISAAIALDNDNPEWTEDMFKRAVRGRQKKATKNKLTIRLDPDVVSYFKSKGRGYQSRINDALRDYMNNHV